ncbi:DUF1282 family protein [candidate division KSB1 bacterium]|nr:DUF1282 family protein [candidate division KSB1 bacterium]
MEKLIGEIKELVISPLRLFERIKRQETTRSEITKSLLVTVAAIPAVAGFFGRVIIGYNVPFAGYSHVSFFSGLAWAVLVFVLTIAGIYVISFIVNSLTAQFGGIKNELNAFKLTAYCFIPLLTLGVFSLIPALSGLYILGLYGIYLFYIGVPVLLQVPEEKALTFTVIVSLVSIVITILFYRIAGLAIVTNMPTFS